MKAGIDDPKRVMRSYDTFRAGFGEGPLSSWRPPHWIELDTWIRDALLVAYIQGKLDGASDAPANDRALAMLKQLRDRSGECLGDHPTWMEKIDQLLAANGVAQNAN